MIPNIKTSLSVAELLKFVKAVNQVRFDKLEEFNLADLGLLEETILSDGANATVGDRLRIDDFVLKKLAESKIKDEQATIAVFNGTKEPGLALKASRVISNIGGNVIIATNLESEKIIENTYLIGSETYPFTSIRLSEIFVTGYDILEDNEISSSRAQINIVLGQDFIDRF